MTYPNARRSSNGAFGTVWMRLCALEKSRSATLRSPHRSAGGHHGRPDEAFVGLGKIFHVSRTRSPALCGEDDNTVTDGTARFASGVLLSPKSDAGKNRHVITFAPS
jgi:hypothetical protein